MQLVMGESLITVSFDNKTEHMLCKIMILPLCVYVCLSFWNLYNLKASLNFFFIPAYDCIVIKCKLKIKNYMSSAQTLNFTTILILISC